MVTHSNLLHFTELEELKVLKKSNSRRDDRLARVRTKNLRSKEVTAERQYADTRNLAASQMVELKVCAIVIIITVVEFL